MADGKMLNKKSGDMKTPTGCQVLFSVSITLRPDTLPPLPRYRPVLKFPNAEQKCYYTVNSMYSTPN